MKVSDGWSVCCGWLIAVVKELIKMVLEFGGGTMFFKIFEDGRREFRNRPAVIN